MGKIKGKTFFMLEIKEIKNMCSRNIDNIFEKLVKKGLIDPEASFFVKSKECVFNGSFYYIHSLIEFLNFPKTNSDFFLYNSYLHAYTHFLDQSLDSLENSPSTKVRSFHISTYLLLNYLKWLTKTYDSKTKIQFYNYYKDYSNYLIMEKKWEFPQYYVSKYGSSKNIYKKALFPLFLLELCKKDFLISKEVTSLKKLFINYFSFALLADDLIDLDFDINHYYLTYPIAIYFKLRHKLPHNRADLNQLIPQMVKTLQSFLRNVKQLEKNIGQHSVIIDEKISKIKNELTKKEIEI